MQSFFKKFFNLFTRITTIIFLISSLYILICFGKDSLLNLYYIWGIIGIGLICSLGYIPFFREKEYSKKTMLLLKIGYAVFCNVVVLFFGYFLGWFSFDYKKTVIGMEICAIIIYLCSTLCNYFIEKSQAAKLNELLKKRQEKK